MPTTQHDEPYCRVLEYEASAELRWHDVPPSDDAAATPFGPPDLECSRQAIPFDPSAPSSKPVLYIPVKKQNGAETFPALRLHLTVIERGELRNVCAPSHRGARVDIEVWNVWGRKRRGPVQLQATLSADDTCDIIVPPATVEKWLDPNGALGGRVNELLLDYGFTFPTLTVDGQPLKGESKTRVYLYRRKVIVFLPGVFGSQVQMKTPDGRTLGFPDFYAEPSSLMDLLQDFLGPDQLASRQIHGAMNQKVGGLECDAAGRPLLEPVKPTLFSLRGVVYDIFDACHGARREYFSDVPESFRLIELRVLAYDWRTDLTECAQALVSKLDTLQTQLRSLPDVDDELALAGHSTGGLILRRALGEPGMQTRVSHAFFISVPFLGAPKALSVILTGQDPPGGDRMIDIVDADSLRDMTLSMPIVYHLAPSAAYPARVAFTPHRTSDAPPAIEEEKRDLVESAINAGFRPRPRFVRASGRSVAERSLLAASADSWHSFWAEASERHRADELYDAMFLRGHPQREAWMPNELHSRGLEAQYAARVPGGWNTELAARAEQFHRESQAIGASEAWAEKSYVFFSVSHHATTLSVHLERASEEMFAGPIDLLKDENISTLRFVDGDVEPPRGEETQAIPQGGTVPAPTVHQWTRVDGRCCKVVWRLWGQNKTRVGDTTVPLKSLLGFGGTARFVPPIQDGNYTAHKDTPKDGRLWLHMVGSLQGTWASPLSTGSQALEAMNSGRHEEG